MVQDSMVTGALHIVFPVPLRARPRYPSVVKRCVDHVYRYSTNDEPCIRPQPMLQQHKLLHACEPRKMQKLVKHVAEHGAVHVVLDRIRGPRITREETRPFLLKASARTPSIPVCPGKVCHDPGSDKVQTHKIQVRHPKYKELTGQTRAKLIGD